VGKAIDITKYWSDPPPEPSPRLAMWMKKIEGGWRPNSRIQVMGYHEAAEFFRVYIWEYFHVIGPALRGDRSVP
jgi:hypothetical protein